MPNSKQEIVAKIAAIDAKIKEIQSLWEDKNESKFKDCARQDLSQLTLEKTNLEQELRNLSS